MRTRRLRDLGALTLPAVGLLIATAALLLPDSEGLLVPAALALAAVGVMAGLAWSGLAYLAYRRQRNRYRLVLAAEGIEAPAQSATRQQTIARPRRHTAPQRRRFSIRPAGKLAPAAT